MCLSLLREACVSSVLEVDVDTVKDCGFTFGFFQTHVKGKGEQCRNIVVLLSVQ